MLCVNMGTLAVVGSLIIGVPSKRTCPFSCSSHTEQKTMRTNSNMDPSVQTEFEMLSSEKMI
mgnify:CR=1 FL=1